MKEARKREVILNETWNMAEAIIKNINQAERDKRIKSKEIEEEIKGQYLIFIENLKRRGYYV